MNVPAPALLFFLFFTSGPAAVAPPDPDPAPPAPAPVEQAPAASPAPAAPPPVAADENLPAPPPVAADEILPTPGEVPPDVAVRVEPIGAATWRVHVTRAGHLVALRAGGERAAGASAAHLDVPRGAAPLVWEATDFERLSTVRGLVRVGDDGAAQVSLAAPPVLAGDDARVAHRCRAHEDGIGGFTVLCRVDTLAAVSNLAGDWSSARVALMTRSHLVLWSAEKPFVHEEWPLLRFDLPALPGRADAFAVTYSAHGDRVVLRVEASRLAGEDRASLAVRSAERTELVQGWGRKSRRFFKD